MSRRGHSGPGDTRTFDGVVMTFICTQTIHPGMAELDRYQSAADGRTDALKGTGRYDAVRRVKRATSSGWGFPCTRYEWFGVRAVVA